MRIEAVITCVDYADFLEHTLPENLNHLDRIVVVTSPEDQATQALCHRYSVDCIVTEVFKEDGGKFNKGKGIMLGQAHLRNEEWLIHMDADILLPHGFRQRLRQASLNPENLYGADRFNIRGYEAYQRVRDQLRPQYQWRYMVTPPPPSPDQNFGARVLHAEFGYCPIGYFQLWHASQSSRRYPVISGSAEHSDLLFSLQWPRQRRILLPEFFVFHLESHNATFGANWQGRKTAKFGPQPKPKAPDAKQAEMHFVPDHGDTFVPGDDGRFHPKPHHHHPHGYKPHCEPHHHHDPHHPRRK